MPTITTYQGTNRVPQVRSDLGSHRPL